MIYMRMLYPYVLFAVSCAIFTSLNYYQITHIKPAELSIWGWNLAKYVVLSIPLATIANWLVQFGYAVLAADKGANKLWMSMAVYYIISLSVSTVCTWVFYGTLPNKNTMFGVFIIVIGVIVCAKK